MYTKRLLAILLSLVMIFAVACSSEPATQETASEETQTSEATEETTEEAATTADGTQPEGFPEKTIEIIVPAAAGGFADIAARALEANTDFGGTSVVVNLPGGNQTVGMLEAFSRPGDGHTLVVVPIVGLAVQPHLTPVDYTLEDFRVLTSVTALSYNGIFVSADSPYNTIEELIEGMKAETLTYASPAIGSIGQIAATQLFADAGVNATHVAYNGNNEVSAALIGGHVDFISMAPSDMKTLVESGQAKALMILGPDRLSDYPDTPSAAESGFDGFEKFFQATFVAIKADTPDDVVEYLKQQIYAGIESQGYQDFLAVSAGAEPYTTANDEEVVMGTMLEANEIYSEFFANQAG